MKPKAFIAYRPVTLLSGIYVLVVLSPSTIQPRALLFLLEGVLEWEPAWS